jgi:glycerophosphoryl diester phosphodiesterase
MKTSLVLLIASLSLQAQEPSRIAIAHRGASGYLPEHTLEAKAAAHAMGAHFIEQDVVLSKDDVPVVLHDIHLDTVTDVAARFPGRAREDGRFYALDFTLADIKTLRVHERVDHKTGKPAYPKRFPVGKSTFEVPTLEEELQLIQGLNQSSGRVAGIYPEIKQPAWHRKQGRDISAIVLPLLRKYGYEDKDDLCFVQCFEFSEVKRLREELGWKGRLIFLMGGGSKKGDDGTDYARLRTPEGLAEVAKFADGIGPAISSVITGKTKAERKITTLVTDAHAAKLAVHPYTLRVDDLPSCVDSAEELQHLIFDEARVDGLFTDFPDVTVRWLARP